MRGAMMKGWMAMAFAMAARSFAQEANSGFDLRATFSAGTALTNDDGSGAGFRSLFYPTLKLGRHWTISGVWQADSRHYFPEGLDTRGEGVKGYLLQAGVTYSLVRQNGSLTVRAGQVASAFGSYPLRYGDMDHPLIGQPLQYGYYATLSLQGLAAAEIDATRGKWDGRVQFANSSPAHPRSVFSSDQYGNWTGGGGYSIAQGLRVGGSAFRGPYLYRGFRYFLPGEWNPNRLDASGVGLDVEWARGHWNMEGEWQRFVFPYKRVPTFREQTGYVEARRVLTPRWYVAARGGYAARGSAGNIQDVEFGAGYRPAANQLLKLSYRMQRSAAGSAEVDRTLALQFSVSVRALSFAAN